jgi:SAM-dependent methyltransferase
LSAHLREYGSPAAVLAAKRFAVAYPTDISHPLFARMWVLLSPGADHAGAAEHRDELLAGLSGRVIEVGAGNGLNFRHYPAAVTEVVALEPEPYLRRRAEQAAAEAPVSVTVVAGVADALPADDGECDAGVVSLVLCSVPDQAAALRELRRVIRPGGELRFYEHVVARERRAAAVQRRLDRWGIWSRVGAGCHLARDTVTAIEEAGFAIERCRRFPFGPGPFQIPHILGSARRPE